MRKYKQIIVLAVLALVLVGCSKNNNIDDIDGVVNYIVENSENEKMSIVMDFEEYTMGEYLWSKMQHGKDGATSRSNSGNHALRTKDGFIYEIKSTSDGDVMPEGIEMSPWFERVAYSSDMLEDARKLDIDLAASIYGRFAKAKMDGVNVSESKTRFDLSAHNIVLEGGSTFEVLEISIDKESGSIKLSAYNQKDNDDKVEYNIEINKKSVDLSKYRLAEMQVEDRDAN